MKPEISVVIPAYNSAAYIAETIQSVQQQDLRVSEIIITDDGSTDDTAKIVEELAQSDSRIKLIKQENGRQGKARNTGIKHASGEWIAFLDADDTWPPEKLSVQLEKTIEAGADLSFTNGYICLGNNMHLRAHRFGVPDRFYQGAEAVQEFHAQNRIPTSSVLVKKEVLLNKSFFPEELEVQNCEDYLLWTTLLDKGVKMLAISDPLLYYRVHEASSTGQEIKLLFPLIHALMRMPGFHGEAIRMHLEKSFMRLIFLLKENNEFESADPFIKSALKKIHPDLKGHLLSLMWLLNKRLFFSLFWRLRVK